MRWLILFAGLGLFGLKLDTAAAQQKSTGRDPGVSGTWQLEKGKVKTDGPRSVVIRPDSSASWGKETVRWRLRGDQIMIALGGEWEVYKLKVSRDKMTLWACPFFCV